MSLLGNTEHYEIPLPFDFATAYDLVYEAANKWGKIIDNNRTLGMIRFKKGMSLTRNPVKFVANISRKGDDNSLVLITANSNDGLIGLNSSDKAYQEFLEVLSKCVE